MEIEDYTKKHIVIYFNYNRFSTNPLGGQQVYADLLTDIIPVNLIIPPEIDSMRIYKQDEHYVYIKDKYYYSFKGEGIRELIFRVTGKVA